MFVRETYNRFNSTRTQRKLNYEPEGTLGNVLGPRVFDDIFSKAHSLTSNTV